MLIKKKYNLDATLNMQLIISLHLILIITHLWCLFLFRLFIHRATPYANDYRTFGALILRLIKVQTSTKGALIISPVC